MFEEKYTFDLQKNIWYCHGISDLAFAFVIVDVGQMYIEQFTNGRFSMMNFYQPRFRHSDRWALLANNNDLKLNSMKDYVKLVKLSVFSFGFLWICSNSSLSVFYSDLPSSDV